MAGIAETWQNIFPCRRGFGGYFNFGVRHATFFSYVLSIISFVDTGDTRRSGRRSAGR
jgi:hypothetical protein